jgi:hypothetical protein
LLRCGDFSLAIGAAFQLPPGKIVTLKGFFLLEKAAFRAANSAI